MHKAEATGDIKQVKQLISQGADINAKNGSGQSPKDLAEGRGYIEIVELLREHGAEE